MILFGDFLFLLRFCNYSSAATPPVRIWTFHPTVNIYKSDDWLELHEKRTTDYCSSGDPGDSAFVLNAIVSYQQYLNLKSGF